MNHPLLVHSATAHAPAGAGLKALVKLCGARAGMPVPCFRQQGCTTRAGGMGGAVAAARLRGIEGKLANRAALAD
jgi:hypothetical protein